MHFTQADNCWRENKNQFVFAFCSWLVAHGLFQEIRLSFLITGHTHEDIDRYFAKISQRLRQFGARTMNELIQVIQDCYESLEVDIVEVRHVISLSICNCDPVY